MSVVGAALEAAGIPSARRGGERARRLTDGERAFYRWILRSFAAGGAPTAAALAEAAASLLLDLEAALGTLAHEDLVHRDPATSTIVVAYPFSARPRGHRVLIDGKHWVEAMCAIDALGIAPMLELPIEVQSRDPITGTEIWARLDPGDGAWWEPTEAVVLAGRTRREVPSFHGCCDVLNFFESAQTAQHYLDRHPDTTGFPISIPDAIEVGRTVFGELLKQH